MRRGSAIAMMTVALLGSCASSERPEGVVERWLLSLNQGAAGVPDRFGGEPATAAATAVLPDWRTREPGSLDRVEVGAAAVSGPAGFREARTPFRIETTDGDVISGTAIAAECGSDPATGGDAWCVRDVRLGGAGPPAGSTWSAGAEASDWARASAAALILSGSAVALVGVVSKRSRSALSASGER
jgi:hypothetical protein